MGISNSNKEVSVERIDCGGTFKIKLSLTAEPDIQSNPVDIVLILDRSESMKDSMGSLKEAADEFIDIIAGSTGGVQSGQIGMGSHIGIVSFDGTAVQDTQLITSVQTLKSVVNSLTAGGSTNHEDAFVKAQGLFNPASPNEKIMIMFTDGVTTAGGDPDIAAEAAKVQGVIIYCIGLMGNGGIDTKSLDEWASDPDNEHVFIAPDDEKLKEIFADLARTIVHPGATDIVITDKVNTCFSILSVGTPDKGTAELLDMKTLQWKIEKLGETNKETAKLEFTVKHIGPCSGTVEANESTVYSDKEGNEVKFPSPEIFIDCGSVIVVEECPEPVKIEVDGCEDIIEFDVGEVGLQSLGRILKLDVTLKNICPHKRVALAVIITEVDHYGTEYSRGFKTFTVPAHSGNECHNVMVRCIKFVLPEDLSVSGSADSICGHRKFKARIIANYIDNNFECCDILL